MPLAYICRSIRNHIIHHVEDKIMETNQKRLVFWGILYTLLILVMIMMAMDILKLDKCATAIGIVNQNHTCDACGMLKDLGLLH